MPKKKSKRNVKKNKLNFFKTKNFILILIPVVILVIILLAFLISNSNDNYITCVKKSEFENGVKQNISLKFYLKKDTVTKVDLNKEIIVDEKLEKAEYSYPNVIKQSIDNIYNNASNYSSKVDKNKVNLKMTYSDNKYHILDDLIITIQDKNVSVNVLTQDNYNSYASIDLSKKVLKSELIKDISKKEFVCK